jgi:N-acetylmuramoyl-L-alanine amidase
MDEKLLKKTAFQSIAFMLMIITLSFALNRYRLVTIEASDKGVSAAIDSFSSSVSSADGKVVKPQYAKAKENDPMNAGLIEKADPLNVKQQLGERFLMIKKPEGNHISIQMEDLFLTKSIRITLSGVIEDNINSSMIVRVIDGEVFQGEPVFIEETDLIMDSEGSLQPVVRKNYGKDIVRGVNITSIYNEFQKSYTSEILITFDHVYVHILHEDAQYYYIDLKKPREVYDKILVIDAGHGGKDAGALSNEDGFYEKDINLDIALHLKELLDQENIKVYYTRLSDDKVFLRPRVELANVVDCDFFISIHCNASTVSVPNGTEVLYYNREFDGIRSKDLAEICLDELAKKIPLVKRGLIEKKDNEIFILNNATVPAVIIEVGYMTNNNDIEYLSKSTNRRAVAQGIYNAIIKAYDTLWVNMGDRN